MSEPLGISITTHTDTCCEYPVTSNIMHLYTHEDRVDSCINCYENKEGRDDNIAHEIVDEGNMQYKRQWLRVTEPSGHDWISSSTRVEPYFVYATQTWEDNREEYKEPTTNLQDGGVYEELWELDDQRQYNREVQCPWCNLMTPRAFNDCQDCDHPLELNLR